MATITLRSVKGSPLTNTEVDNNFTNLNNDKLESSSYTAADVLSKLLTVDGTGSSLDADLLDGLNTSSSDTSGNTVVTRSSGNFSAGTITATLSGTATNATNVAITNDTTTNGTHYVHLGDATSGNDGVKVSSTKLTFNPSTGTLTATAFSGDGSNLTSVTASSATTATNATNVAVTTSTTSSDFKIPFANTTVSTTGNYGLLQDSTATFTYNPSTNTLTVDNIVAAAGNITLNAQGDLRFADSDSSNWVAFQAPATVASNVTWTLPSADGSSGTALVTDGSGTLSWGSAGISTGKAIAMAIVFGG